MNAALQVAAPSARQHPRPVGPDRGATVLAPVIPLVRPGTTRGDIALWLDEEEPTTEQLAAARRTARRRLPAPVGFVRSVAMAVLEIEAGCRSAVQLERRCTPEAWAQADAQLRRTGGAFADGRSVLRVHCQELQPGVADAVAVVRRGRHVAAVAMRVEAIRDRWTVTELLLRP